MGRRRHREVEAEAVRELMNRNAHPKRFNAKAQRRKGFSGKGGTQRTQRKRGKEERRKRKIVGTG
jgi:hypothetical protein